jgi:hypothetical protein
MVKKTSNRIKLPRNPTTLVGRPGEAESVSAVEGRSDLLLIWRIEARCTGVDASPELLPIRVVGATLQNLEGKCAPH